jgi:hypothetical protein
LSSDVDRRVTFDRAVWTKPLAFAADAALSYVLSIVGVPGVRADRIARVSSIVVVTTPCRSSLAGRAVSDPALRYTSGARVYAHDERRLPDRRHRL